MSERKDTLEGRPLDVVGLLRYFLKRIWLILLCAAVGGYGMLTFVVNRRPDMYTASAIMYVYINNPNQTNYQYVDQSALNSAARLMQTYMVVIKSNKVMDAVSARLDYEYDAGFIANCIQVASVSGTEVMSVSATTTNPQLSMDICNAVAEFAPPEIIRVVNAGVVEVIDYATLPEAPDPKGMLTTTAIGVGSGGLVACGALLLLFMWDRHLRDDTDLPDHFELATLMAVPNPRRIRLRGHGGKNRFGAWPDDGDADGALPGLAVPSAKGKLRHYLISEATPALIVEYYKLFRVNLSVCLEGAKNNIVVVTSAIPGEGKSTISANLAIVAALDNRRVLLIDADMRKPSQSKLFGVEESAPGLSELLSGLCKLEDVLWRDMRPGLDLIPSGSMPYNPVELLNSPAMRQNLESLSGQYGWIIIDTPPINVVADPLVLAGKVAGAVLVTRRNVSDLSEIELAMKKAGQVGMKLFGFVLMDASRKRAGWRYKRVAYYKEYGVRYRRTGWAQPKEEPIGNIAEQEDEEGQIIPYKRQTRVSKVTRTDLKRRGVRQ